MRPDLPAPLVVLIHHAPNVEKIGRDSLFEAGYSHLAPKCRRVQDRASRMTISQQYFDPRAQSLHQGSSPSLCGRNPSPEPGESQKRIRTHRMSADFVCIFYAISAEKVFTEIQPLPEPWANIEQQVDKTPKKLPGSDSLRFRRIGPRLNACSHPLIWFFSTHQDALVLRAPCNVRNASLHGEGATGPIWCGIIGG